MTVSYRKCSICLILTFLFLFAILCIKPIPSANAQQTQENYIVTEWGAEILSKITQGTGSLIYNFASINATPISVAVDHSGNYIVAALNLTTSPHTGILYMIAPNGTRTIISTFPGIELTGVVVDPNTGDYIVTENTATGTGMLSAIAPNGTSTTIYTFNSIGTTPIGVAVDPNSGNYIVAEYGINTLSMITPNGTRTVICNLPSGANPAGVAVDPHSGNYIVTELGDDKLSTITPNGTRSVIYNFTTGTEPWGIAIDPKSGNYIVTEYSADKLSMITPNGTRSVIYSFPSGSGPTDVAVVSVVSSTASSTSTKSSTSTTPSTTPITISALESGYFQEVLLILVVIAIVGYWYMMRSNKSPKEVSSHQPPQKQ